MNDAWWEAYETWLVSEGYRPSTVTVAVLGAKRFQDLINRQCVLSMFTASFSNYSHAFRYQRWLEETGRIQEPQREAFEELTKMKRQLKQKSKRKKKARSIALDDWKRLWAAVLEDESPAARVLEIQMTTALRCGDVLRLERAQVVRGIRAETLIVELKGGREIFVSTRTAPGTWTRVIEDWPKKHETVSWWVCPDGDGSTESSGCSGKRVARKLSELCKKSKVDGRHNTHRIRRTVAVQLFRLTKDIVAVQKLLGHKSITTTQNYLDEAEPEMMAEHFAQLASLRED